MWVNMADMVHIFEEFFTEASLCQIDGITRN